MLNLIVRLLLGIITRGLGGGSPEQLCVDVKVFARYLGLLFSPTSSTRGLRATGLPSVRHTLGCKELGLKVMVLEVSLSGWLLRGEAQYIIGGPIWKDSKDGRGMTEVAKAHLSYDAESKGYQFKEPSILMDMEILERAVWMLMPKDDRTIGTMTPDRVVPSPLRLIGNLQHGVTIMITRLGAPTFTQVCKEHGINPADLARRGAKDIWGCPIGMRRTVRILVTKAPKDGGMDGEFYLRDRVSHSPIALYRGVGHMGGKAFLIKGRGITDDALLSTYDDDIDGVTTTDNVKWSNVAPGTVVELDLVPVEDQTGHAREGGYGWHSMAMLFMWQPKEQWARMKKAFTSHVKGLSKSFKWDTSHEGYVSGLIDLENRLREEEAGFAIVQSNLSKHVLGISTNKDEDEMWASQYRKVTTKKTRVSQYPCIIFTSNYKGMEVRPEAPLFNGAMNSWARENDLLGTPLTMMRYPVASAGSYLRVKLEKDNVISLADDTPLVVAHPRCAKHLQGDGDDHVLITPEWISDFDPNNEPMQGRNYEKVAFKSTLLSLLQVWQAQNGIGLIFNCMAKTVGSMRALGQKEDAITAEMNFFGGQLDLYAQAVKKPYALTPPISLIKIAKWWTDLAHKEDVLNPEFDGEHYYLALLIGANLKSATGPDELDFYVEKFYGERLALSTECKVTEEDLRERHLANGVCVRKHTSAIAKVKTIYDAVKWHMALVKELLGEGTWDEIEVDVMMGKVDTYAEIAFSLKVWVEKNNSAAEMCLRQMSGNWIAASQVEDGYLC